MLSTRPRCRHMGSESSIKTNRWGRTPTPTASPLTSKHISSQTLSKSPGANSDLSIQPEKPIFENYWSDVIVDGCQSLSQMITLIQPQRSQPRGCGSCAALVRNVSLSHVKSDERMEKGHCRSFGVILFPFAEEGRD